MVNAPSYADEPWSAWLYEILREPAPGVWRLQFVTSLWDAPRETRLREPLYELEALLHGSRNLRVVQVSPPWAAIGELGLAHQAHQATRASDELTAKVLAELIRDERGGASSLVAAGQASSGLQREPDDRPTPDPAAGSERSAEDAVGTGDEPEPFVIGPRVVCESDVTSYDDAPWMRPLIKRFLRRLRERQEREVSAVAQAPLGPDRPAA